MGLDGTSEGKLGKKEKEKKGNGVLKGRGAKLVKGTPLRAVMLPGQTSEDGSENGDNAVNGKDGEGTIGKSGSGNPNETGVTIHEDSD
ncbi:MAG: hypothetical protein LQ340_007095 [Diploschistes diacapsis]|nr:MAG: hypothetical protein LQ340_007095 [Diploschistes diacapsis]